MIDEFDTSADNPPEPEPAPLHATQLKRLDVSSPYFQERLREQHNLERIGADLDMANRELDVSERVLLELKSATQDFDSLPMVHFCAQHVWEWFLDKNPHHIDLVMMVCSDHGIEPTPTIIELATEVARARITGAPAGTPDKILKEHAKRQAFTLMMNLIDNGAPLAEAADKAAQWLRDNYPNMDTGKASSLDKEYSKRYRRSGVEKRHFDSWNKDGSEDRRIYWRKIRGILPLADPDLMGSRR